MKSENTGEDLEHKEPVDRQRRFVFVAWVTGFCLVTAVVLTYIGGIFMFPPAASPLVDLYIRGTLGLASATVLAYVSGSVIDYNGGIGRLFSPNNKDVK